MPRNIRVIHVITRLDMGGSAQETLLTVLNLDQQGYEITLVKGSTSESAMTPAEFQVVNQQLSAACNRGIKVINLSSMVRRISPWNDFRTFVFLYGLTRKYKPQIVHTHTSKAGVLGRLAAWLAHVPVIIHKPHGHVFYGHFSPSLSKLFLLIERLLGRITHHLVALTPEEAKDYLTLRVAKPQSISIIHSGVDLSRFLESKQQRRRKRKELRIPQRSLVVGFVGWLTDIKGVSFLVKAMVGVQQQHPDTLLVLVGKGDEEVNLKKQVEAMGIADRVRFLGWRPDVNEIMGCFDIFVLPSLNEGMGRVLVEAMSAGLPIVASRVGGIPDLVKHGENGLLVPPANAGALERAISDLLSDKARRKRMGETGKRMCRPYSVEAMADKIDDLYSRLVEERSFC